VSGLAGQRAQAGVFASTLLEDRHPLQVPPGHYDPAQRLYIDSRTGAPMFVKPADGGAPQVLSSAELDELARTFDVRDASKRIQIAQSCTISRQTSYSTTSCCPIVTDSKNDQECDDTPEKDKDWK